LAPRHAPGCTTGASGPAASDDHGANERSEQQMYLNEVDRGNHFAAWQEHEQLASEVRAAIRPIR